MKCYSTAGSYLIVMLTCVTSDAEIFRLDNGALIPGTEGIEPRAGVNLDHKELKYASLRELELTGASFAHSNLTNADLAFSRLKDVSFEGATLANVNFRGTIVIGADLRGTTLRSFTKEQLYTTDSYQARDLQGIDFSENDLTGWDFSGQNLTSSRLGAASTLTGVDITGALVTGVNFGNFSGHSNGFTKEQLYSTASYQAKDLREVSLWSQDLTDWDFSSQDLTNANLGESTLTRANLTGATVTGVNFGMSAENSIEFTKEQLYSTASYQARNLQGIGFRRLGGTPSNDLSGWDFSGQDLSNGHLWLVNLSDANLAGANLTNSSFHLATLTNANLIGANLKNVNFATAPLAEAVFDSTTVYNQWTVFPNNFEPSVSGMTFVESPHGDFDGNDILDASDVELLVQEILMIDPLRDFRDDMFDMNSDSGVDQKDLRVWVTNVKRTWFGDSNLDGEFDSSDLVTVFEAGQYEDGAELNSIWTTGDWNADGDFTSLDMVVAFQDGGFERGPRVADNIVPEPATFVFLMAGLIGIAIRRRHCVFSKQLSLNSCQEIVGTAVDF